MQKHLENRIYRKLHAGAVVVVYGCVCVIRLCDPFGAKCKFILYYTIFMLNDFASIRHIHFHFHSDAFIYAEL